MQQQVPRQVLKQRGRQQKGLGQQLGQQQQQQEQGLAQLPGQQQLLLPLLLLVLVLPPQTQRVQNQRVMLPLLL